MIISALLLLPPLAAWLLAERSRVERYQALSYLAFAEWVGCNTLMSICHAYGVPEFAPVCYACVHLLVLAIALLQRQTAAVILFELLVATAIGLRVFHVEQNVNTVELANYTYIARCLVVVGFSWMALRLQSRGVTIDPGTGGPWYERDAVDVERQLERRSPRAGREGEPGGAPSVEIQHGR